MSRFEELFPGSSISLEDMMDDFRVLGGYFQSLEMPVSLLEASDTQDVPVMVVEMEGGTEEAPEPFYLTLSLLPMDDEVATNTKYLQLYHELDVDLSGVDRVDLLELLHRCNSSTAGPIGIITPPRGEEGCHLAIRYVQAFLLNQPISAEIFLDLIDGFTLFTDVVQTVAQELADSGSLEEALSILGG